MTEPPSGWNAPDGGSGWTTPPGYGPPSGYGEQGGYGPPTGYGPSQPWVQAPRAPEPGVVPLRPLGLGELLDGAIKILRRYPRPTLGLSAAIATVVTVINVLLVVALNSAGDLSSSSDSTGTDFQFQLSSSAATSGPGSIISFLAGLVLTGALVAVVGKAVLGQPVSTAEVWQTVRGRLWALLGLSLLTGLIVALPMVVGGGLAVVLGISLGPGSLLLGIPLAFAGIGLAIYAYTRLALAAPALVLEKAGVTAALRRSSVLVRGAWWRTFWILVLTAIIGAVLAGILTFPATIVALLAGDPGSTGFLVTQQVAAGLASVLVSPFTSGVRALLYVDRRMRAEGLDVSLAAAAAGAAPS
jgi:hypothetical protein